MKTLTSCLNHEEASDLELYNLQQEERQITWLSNNPLSTLAPSGEYWSLE